MSKLPKLKVKRTWNPVEETHDLEQARYLLFSGGDDMLVLVEGQAVNSYEELVQMASRDDYRDRKFLEIMLIPFLNIGG